MHRDISRGSTDRVYEKNMSRKVSQNWAFLNLLATASVKQRRKFVKDHKLQTIEVHFESDLERYSQSRNITIGFFHKKYLQVSVAFAPNGKEEMQRQENSGSQASRLSSHTFRTLTSETRQICQLTLW